MVGYNPRGHKESDTTEWRSVSATVGSKLCLLFLHTPTEAWLLWKSSVLVYPDLVFTTVISWFQGIYVLGQCTLFYKDSDRTPVSIGYCCQSQERANFKIPTIHWGVYLPLLWRDHILVSHQPCLLPWFPGSPTLSHTPHICTHTCTCTHTHMHTHTYILKRAMLNPAISGRASGMKLRVTLRPHRFHSPNA